jgi:hypothetical protein
MSSRVIFKPAAERIGGALAGTRSLALIGLLFSRNPRVIFAEYDDERP